ncbi:MAG: hypothetical protein CMK59_14785 [Proteobacteria bacterium]|nr:hypothetical protein [Pseudomonadota bacterium]
MERQDWNILIACALAIAIASFYGVCTQDDAFISFRYAENLVTGKGLVFNEGERVEGISNPLWTLMFAGVIAFGMDPVLWSIVFGLCFFSLAVWGTSRLSSSVGAGLLPVWLVALDPSFLLESMEGLESSMYVALIVWGFVFLLQDIERTEYLPWRSLIVFGAAILTRPDAPLFFVAAQAGILLYRPSIQSIRFVCRSSVILGVFLSLVTAVRYGYYGEFLPNTFYAKVGGVAIERGLNYLWAHISTHPLVWIGGVYLCLQSLHIKRLRIVLPFVLGHALYVLLIGGDFKPTSRFLLVLTPILALGASLMILRWSNQSRWAYGLVVFAILPRAGLYERSLDWAQTRRINFLGRKAAGEWIAQNTPPDWVMAMHSVGAVPYYAQRRCIDMWGLNDKVIARTPVPDFGSGLAGHERSNPEYVFSLQPDLYIPEDDWLGLQRIEQKVELGFPSDFEENYRPVSIPLGASWMNIWYRK